ncbi:uncharacterized protein LOC130015168 [Mercurialis annua]|uniref:uncharacterized protein LOC130015168 n=1 Tax=Mercurialis annua TaxID=3986 RepID=UPI0024AED2BC|nr:uncharacterized protein LOC130015168 [Mercurialis annua]
MTSLSEDVPPENSEEDRIPKADDRSTKKAKLRSDDPHDNPVGGMSFRDKVLQSSRGKEDIFESSFEDFYLSGEDVSMNFEEGLPSIHFSSRVQDELSKPWLKTVVIKLLGRPIGYKNLCNRLENIWKFSRGFDVIDLENDYFLVRFWSGSDVEAVLTGGPWVILGHYLSVQAWSPNFDCTSDCINSIHAWIRLPGMPIHYYNKQVLRYIGQMVRKVVEIDYCTESVERGKFARIAVELDLRKALVSQFVLDGKVQRVEYECLPRICFSCGKFGHTKDNCPEIITTGQNSNQANDEGKTSNKPTRTEKMVPAENPSYGPWMIVNKRGKSKPDYGHSKDNKSSNSVRDNDWRGSRFQILENTDMEVGLNGDNNPNIEEEVADKNLTGEGSLHARVYDSQSAANDTFSSKVSSKSNHKKDTIEKPTKEGHQLKSRYNMRKIDKYPRCVKIL